MSKGLEGPKSHDTPFPTANRRAGPACVCVCVCVCVMCVCACVSHGTLTIRGAPGPSVPRGNPAGQHRWPARPHLEVAVGVGAQRDRGVGRPVDHAELGPGVGFGRA